MARLSVGAACIGSRFRLPDGAESMLGVLGSMQGLNWDLGAVPSIHVVLAVDLGFAAALGLSGGEKVEPDAAAGAVGSPVGAAAGVEAFGSPVGRVHRKGVGRGGRPQSEIFLLGGIEVRQVAPSRRHQSSYYHALPL